MPAIRKKLNSSISSYWFNQDMPPSSTQSSLTQFSFESRERTTPTEIPSDSTIHYFKNPLEIRRFCEEADRKIVYLLGHGAKGMYADVASLESECDALCDEWIEKYDTLHRVVVVFGGDPLNLEKPCLGQAARFLMDRGCTVLAIQAKKILDWGGLAEDANRNCTHAHLYDTDQHLTDQQPIAWAGIQKTATATSDRIVGTSRICWSAYLFPFVAEVVCLGGGAFALDDVLIADDLDIPVRYSQFAKAANTDDDCGGVFGEVDPHATYFAERRSKLCPQPPVAQSSWYLPALATVAVILTSIVVHYHRR